MTTNAIAWKAIDQLPQQYQALFDATLPLPPTVEHLPNHTELPTFRLMIELVGYLFAILALSTVASYVVDLNDLSGFDTYIGPVVFAVFFIVSSSILMWARGDRRRGKMIKAGTYREGVFIQYDTLIYRDGDHVCIFPWSEISGYTGSIAGNKHRDSVPFVLSYIDELGEERGVILKKLEFDVEQKMRHAIDTRSVRG